MAKIKDKVEVKALVSEQKYIELLDFHKKNSNHITGELKTIFHLSGDKGLKIEKGLDSSRVWIESEMLEHNQIEINAGRDDFDTLLDFFNTLGHDIETKWFRRVNEFDWDGIKVNVDFIRGYGYLIHLQIEDPDDVQIANHKLKEKLRFLGLEETPKEIIEEKTRYYEDNWRDLV